MAQEIVRELVAGVWRTVRRNPSGGGSLPPGGSTGEVLTKESNADGDAGWEPSGGSVPDLGSAANSYQVCAGWRGQLATEANWASQAFLEYGCADGLDVFVAWYIPGEITVAEFAWKIDTPAVGLYRLGIYAATAGWQPADLIWDSGQQDGEVAAVQTDAVSLTLSGRYLQVMCCDADAIANGPAIYAYNYNTLSLVDTGTPTIGGGDNEDQASGIFTRARAFGALPDPGDPWTAQLQIGGNSNWPLFCKLA